MGMILGRGLSFLLAKLIKMPTFISMYIGVTAFAFSAQ
jgi:hypothetical protein